MMSFRDVVVMPYSDLLDTGWGREYHRGGPHWPDWATQRAARHCVQGEVIDVEPAEAEPVSTLDDEVAWGGPITGEFGHQIADFSARLLPTLAEMPDARFAFGVRENFQNRFRTWEETPLASILRWYGISGEQVRVVSEPTFVKHLFVAPQAEQFLGPGPEPWYLDLLDAHTRERLGEVEQSGSLYVSRAGQHARFAGEAYLEIALEEAGYRVLRPEAVPLEDQLRAYASAESVVFAEGSAIHSMQLMGRVLSDVTVLVRRVWGGLVMAQEAIRPRARSLRPVDATRGLVHGFHMGSLPWPEGGLSILDPQKLQAGLSISHVWDQKAFDRSVDADVEEWLEIERASPRWSLPGSAELVAATMRAAGLAEQ